MKLNNRHYGLLLAGLICLPLAPLTQAQTEQAEPEPAAEETTAPEAQKTAPGAQKTVESATINLRTTVMGNQEQPRVFYVMPWQSPETPALDMQMLSSQQDAVFGHVEREELLRHLEASGELDEEE